MKKHFIKSIKIAIAALLTIIIAGEIGLQYAATAGIVTVLSIQNTKKETLKTAFRRGVAYVCAVILAGICFGLFGFHVFSFGAYLFLFSLLCLSFGWVDAIAMDSVLISHFLLEGNMSPELLWNETLVFLLGSGMGILVNLHLHSKEAVYSELAKEVDGKIKEILRYLSEWMRIEKKEICDEVCFQELEKTLEKAQICAVENYNNRFLGGNSKEIDYIGMRGKQKEVLESIYQNIRSLSYLPKQATRVSELFAKIEGEFHRTNTVEGLLKELEFLLSEMRKEELPKKREEFEARAVLFYILKQTEELLLLKREFIQKWQLSNQEIC